MGSAFNWFHEFPEYLRAETLRDAAAVPLRRAVRSQWRQKNVCLWPPAQRGVESVSIMRRAIRL